MGQVKLQNRRIWKLRDKSNTLVQLITGGSPGTKVHWNFVIRNKMGTKAWNQWLCTTTGCIPCGPFLPNSLFLRAPSSCTHSTIDRIQGRSSTMQPSPGMWGVPCSRLGVSLDCKSRVGDPCPKRSHSLNQAASLCLLSKWVRQSRERLSIQLWAPRFATA